MEMDESQQSSSKNKVYYVLSELRPHTSIYRYMDLDFFLCMLKRKKLYVSKRRTFHDKDEKQLPIKFFLPPHVVNTKQPNLKEETEAIMEKWRSYRETGDWPVSCWTLRNDENYLMWKSYTTKFGVRIATTIDRLVDSITPNNFNIWCGQLTYKGFHAVQEIGEMLFSKSAYYSNEEEVRFYFEPKSANLFDDTASDNGIEIPLKLTVGGHHIFSEVVLSPFIKNDAAKVLCEMLQNMDELKDCQIKKSHIRI